MPKITLMKRLKLTKEYINQDLVQVPKHAWKISIRKDTDYYETLCCYCAEENINTDNVSQKDFDNCINAIENFVVDGSKDYACENVYFYID